MDVVAQKFLVTYSGSFYGAVNVNHDFNAVSFLWFLARAGHVFEDWLKGVLSTCYICKHPPVVNVDTVGDILG